MTSHCRTDSGQYIIVEMQNRWHSHFLDRICIMYAVP